MKRDLKALIGQMTLEEKASLCSGSDFWHTQGIERLGIPAVMVTDGPHGLRKQAGEADHLGLNDSVEAVCFPAGCATGSSFDPDLLEHMGQVLGDECQAEDVSILLGPAVNIKRSPLCGRNFEYISEDPYLAGKLSAAYIRGVQSRGVGTSIKHFAANNQETRRLTISSDLSERALHEIYLPAFEEAVKAAQPKTVMCSYNKINGVYASENKMLLTDILRDQWGFEGYVVSDWGASNDRVKGLEAGLDLEMPSSNGYNDAKIVAAVQNGSLDEAVLDRAVERILKVVFSYVDARRPDTVFDRAKDHAEAVAVETQCAVLLTNQGVLPLGTDQKIAYIGEFAAAPRYQGGGSSHIHPSRVTSAWEVAQQKGRNVCYAKGFSAMRDEMTDAELAEAIQAAQNADVAVVFAGLPESFESEGYDRTSMELPACQNRLIDEIAKVQPHVVVVLHNGSAVELPWADRVSAILELYLGGEGVGEAADQLLYGETNPSGHLAETFPLRLQDNPSYLHFPGNDERVAYGEDVFVGYRYYDTKQVPVRFAFGHGLSYTEFAYSNLQLSAPALQDGQTVTVSVDVTNTGKVAGREVVQLYIRDKNGTPERPSKELRGFAKVLLEPGECKTVTLTLAARDLSYYEERLHDWFAPSGVYEVMVGRASDDIRLTAELSFTTEKQLPFVVTLTTTLGELLTCPKTAPTIMQLLAPLAQSAGTDGLDEGSMNMMKKMIMEMPLKSLVSVIPGDQVELLIQQMNLLLAQ